MTAQCDACGGVPAPDAKGITLVAIAPLVGKGPGAMWCARCVREETAHASPAARAEFEKRQTLNPKEKRRA